MSFQVVRNATFITALFFSFHYCAAPKKPVSADLPLGRDSGTATPIPAVTKTDTFLQNLLQQRPQQFENLLANRDSLRLQIIYTQINRGADNKPVFNTYYYNVNPDRYFYPASTVKMPTALLALQRLNELRIPGLDKNSTMITEADYAAQNQVFNDPSTPDGRPTIAQYVRKIFLVSDNDAFNRLYEFLGQEYINNRLWNMGYTRTEIIHRLERFLTEDENRHTNPVNFYNDTGKLLYTQPVQFNQRPYLKRNDWLGQGFYRAGKKEEGPMDFSKKNRLVLEDLHQLLRSILFPAEVPAKQRFNISADDYRFVWKYMSQYPGETQFPSYAHPEYWDAYCKFLYWGSEKQDLPRSFRIFNKVGDAYGFLTDAAYIVDFEKNIEFILSATIYCNSDGILNDSKYDYDSVGLPFMKNLGRLIYDYELSRQRSHVPDLSTFRLDYEK